MPASSQLILTLSDDTFQPAEPKTEKGIVSLGISKRMSKRISLFELTNESWIREKFSTNEVLNNPSLIARISL